MKHSLTDVLSVFTPLAEMPEMLREVKENFPMKIFSDISNPLVISDLKLLNFVEALKLPNLRQNRGAQSHAKQYTARYNNDHQHKVILRPCQEESVQWDKPDAADTFEDLLCDDVRRPVKEPTKQTGQSNVVIDVMDLITKSNDEPSQPPKAQKPSLIKSKTEDVEGTNHTPRVPAGDEIEDVLQKIENDSAPGPLLDHMSYAPSIPIQNPADFHLPTMPDMSVFGVPAMQYAHGISVPSITNIPEIQPLQNQFMFPMYPPSQHMVGVGGLIPGVGVPAMPNVNMAGIYPMQVQQPLPINDVSWEYLDLNNVIRGPFSNQMMQEWYKGGSLPENLRIRIHGDTGAFIPLIKRWAKSLARGFAPFSTPPSESSYQ